MYELFDLEGRGVSLRGYHFPCEDPNHVVVLIHGIGEYAGRYLRIADRFREAGIAMVGMDLRGHGRSSGKRGHCAPREEVLKDIDYLLDYAQKLYPGVPIVVYGHSMGGNIGIDYMERGSRNDLPQKYMFSGPWIRLVRPIGGALLSLVKVMSRLAPQMTINSNCKEENLGNPEKVRPYRSDSLIHSKVSMCTAWEGFCIGKELEDGTHADNGRAHGVPTLIMHGGSDMICDIEGTRTFVKNYGEKLKAEGKEESLEFMEWPGYYHEIHNGGPTGETGDEVIKKMIGFITGAESSDLSFRGSDIE